ncbi:hypothetical protein [Tenacibaculum sp. M341]|uniref:hypothetical protein n=1 Tax=Tenacibaculum sp. M341 TaxID=2530339 RepID=UPI0010446816|nr:hypothetical protein [Tenacibaculum sp. M341]TCI85421.1 hypothetical protein EYW44_16865 [Tenacibaculum sp. M341]
MIKYFTFFISILLIGCNSKENKKLTYFGGKIINPKDSFVLLFDHNDEIVDSIAIEKNHTFMGKLENIHSGLYYFKHGAELQYVFLEPKDSLLIRLNTWDFDESLVFSGTNADRNNLLVESFLSNEEEQRNFYKYYNLPAKEFKHKVDSLEQTKKDFIEEYKLNNTDYSEKFIDILNVALHYPLYTKIESFIIDNSLKDQPEQIDSSFVEHRNTASINNSQLMFYTPYREYVYNHLYSDIYKKKIEDDSDEFTIALLNAINEKIDSEKLKNKLLKETTIRHFYNKKSCSINKKAFDTFISSSTNEKDKEEISLLVKDVKGIKKHKRIPNFSVTAPDGAIENINSVIKHKNAVIYFRNKQYSSDSWVASRMNYLINNNPNIEFLVININNEKNQYIKELDIKHQYYLNSESNAHNFLSSKFPRMVLINKKGIVENGFCALSSKAIEKQITEL